MNYFALLNLPVTFDIDMPQLDTTYFAAQRRHHPDRHRNMSANERARAAQESANLNDAYQTLKNPLKRAKHMLALHKITVLDEANSAKPNTELLSEIMELQEAMAEGKKPDIAALIHACESDISTAFRNHDLESAKNSTIRLSYLTKLSHHHH